jgi:hypothetical protein
MIVDEPYLHYNIIKSRCRVTELAPGFNAMMYFKAADGYFLHWANVLDRKDRVSLQIMGESF